VYNCPDCKESKTSSDENKKKEKKESESNKKSVALTQDKRERTESDVRPEDFGMFQLSMSQYNPTSLHGPDMVLTQSDRKINLRDCVLLGSESTVHVFCKND